MIILVLGALAWGWLGMTGHNPFDVIKNTTARRTIYIIIGIIGLLMAIGAAMMLYQNIRYPTISHTHTQLPMYDDSRPYY